MAQVAQGNAATLDLVTGLKTKKLFGNDRSRVNSRRNG
jgi:hypothetical protein